MAEFSVGEEMSEMSGVDVLFVAAGTTLTFFSYGSGGSVRGNNIDTSTYITLEELNNYDITTAFN